MSGLTSAVVRSEFLDRAMESTAHNLDQFNPSPETDSILELLRDTINTKIFDLVLRQELMELVVAAIHSNRFEGIESQAIAAKADQVTTDLHRMETAGIKMAVSGKAVAARLRDPLKIVRTPAGRPAKEITDAHLSIKAAVAEIPAAQLTSRSARYELGAKNFRALESYLTGVRA